MSLFLNAILQIQNLPNSEIINNRISNLLLTHTPVIILDPFHLAEEIREAGDKNQQAFKGTMEAVRVAQMMITSLQIEAKNKDRKLRICRCLLQQNE